jgi:hypothetical protein
VFELLIATARKKGGIPQASKPVQLSAGLEDVLDII